MSYLSSNSAESDSKTYSLECHLPPIGRCRGPFVAASSGDDNAPLREARSILRAVTLGTCFWLVVALLWLSV